MLHPLVSVVFLPGHLQIYLGTGPGVPGSSYATANGTLLIYSKLVLLT